MAEQFILFFMRVYRLFFGGVVEEGDEPDDFFTTSIKEARDRAKEYLGDEYSDGDHSYVDITEMEVITSGRGYILALLNRKKYARDVKDIERWQWLDDGHGGVPRKVTTKVPPVMTAFRTVNEGTTT